MLKIRQFLTSVVEYLGWGLIGPAVICGVYFVANILFAPMVASVITMSVFIVTLFVTVAVTSDRKSDEELSFSAGFVIWIIVSLFLTPRTSVSISKTTLLVASIVYGAILVNKLLAPATEQSSE